MSAPLHQARFRLEHRWARRLMSDYLEDELGSRRRRRMERHLGECEECRRLLAGLRELISVLHGLSRPTGVDAGRVASLVRVRIQEPGSP